jgi:hypothetical protein
VREREREKDDQEGDRCTVELRADDFRIEGSIVSMLPENDEHNVIAQMTLTLDLHGLCTTHVRNDVYARACVRQS